MNQERVDRSMKTTYSITSKADLEHIDQLSMKRRVFIFKHSTRCGISHAALNEVQTFADRHEDIRMYMIDVLKHREVSDIATERYGKPHHSPQVLVIEKGMVLHHATHYGIDQKWLKKAMY